MTADFTDVFTGEKYEPGRPLSEIVTLVRADLAAALTGGQLPAGVSLTVAATTDPGLLEVVIKGVPAEFGESATLLAVISRIANAYNRIARPVYGEGDGGSRAYQVVIVHPDQPALTVAADQIQAHAGRWRGQLREDERLTLYDASLALTRVAATTAAGNRDDL